MIKAAVLLADISGFTKLSGDLCLNGTHGLDDLRQATSSFLSKFISIVYAYGGDVLAFAGDALICMFWVHGGKDSAEYHDVCRQAIECGYILKDHCTDKLTAHIAVSFGELCFAFLGGHNNDWVYVVSGECMLDLSPCIDEAMPRQLVVSPGCYVALHQSDISRIGARRLPSGNILIESIRDLDKANITSAVAESSTRPGFIKRFGSSMVSVASSGLEVDDEMENSVTSEDPSTGYVQHILKFLPHPVVSSLSAGYFHGMSELRVVTTMFLKLDSYNVVLHRNLTSLQRFFSRAQEALAASGGCLRQFLIDDKGCVMIALWGVPSASFANNSARAVYCASSISCMARQLDHICSVGITTGSAFCGTIGSALRQDYTAIGNSVNMAARLMGKARGGILVDYATQSTLPDIVKTYLDISKPLQLKGSTEPVTPFVVRMEDLDGESLEDLFNRVLKTFSAHQRDETLDNPENSDSDSHRPMVYAATDSRTLRTNLNEDIVDSLHRAMDVLLERGYGGSQHRRSSMSDRYSDDGYGNKMQCIVLEGSQGMGKTEVAKYFRKLSLDLKIRCFSIRAHANEDKINYGVMRRLFTTIVGEDLQTSKNRKNASLELLRRTYPYLSVDDIITLKFPVLKMALGLKWHLSLRRPPLLPHQSLNIDIGDVMTMRSTCANLLVDIMETLLQGCPSTIILEDAHYCDQLTWNTLHVMSNTLCAPLTALITARRVSIEEMLIPSLVQSTPRELLTSPTHGGLSRGGSRLRKARGFRIRKTPVMIAVEALLSSGDADSKHANFRLVLTDITLEQTRRILELVLESSQITDSFVALVNEVSTRNPYWCKTIAEFVNLVGIENFMKSIESCGALTTISDIRGSASDDDIDSDEFECEDMGSSNKSRCPSNSTYLRLLVTCMMDNLTITEQIVLKFSSVIGQRFAGILLYRILPDDTRSRSKHALNVLVKRRFIVRIPGDTPLYSFQNSYIREVVYSFMPPSDAAVLHANIAREIEDIYSPGLESHYDMLIYHSLMGMQKSSFDSTFDDVNQRMEVSKELKRKAFKYAMKAAALATANHCLHDAMDYLQFSESIAELPEQLIKIVSATNDTMSELQTTLMKSDSKDSNLDFNEWEPDGTELSDFRQRIQKKLIIMSEDSGDEEG
eukprot:CAMPEP_0185038434 /NCGR_PEP_ID=MMETSP1103-20130426/34075_1 /TAXON_ID=36769 /ORGANISM="Paraphysomonas bandaiensis, Strain Caron Lab Isolate" /LENGTH=1145 /DNA_ID=CAMNT_0027576861 /DNA_START=129 /DNA_END=3566 /DNA_ORIENTATION=-